MRAEILEGNAADSAFWALKSSRLLQYTRFQLRQLHLAYSTEECYVRWIECSVDARKTAYRGFSTAISASRSVV